MTKHTLEHALYPARSDCRCQHHEMTECVICGRRKEFFTDPANHPDTCGANCRRTLSELQRRST